MAKIPTCFDCAYAYWELGRAAFVITHGPASGPACANHPESLGRMRPTPWGQVCRNFRPRPATPKGEVRQIPLGEGFYVYVDAADYDWLSQWTWWLHNGYAARQSKSGLVYMHREIMQAPRGKDVDHTNRNKLDNTRLNLWVCTRGENARNKGKRRGRSSRFRGVSHCKAWGKWTAAIGFEGKSIWLGYFIDEIEAARAYDRKAVELFGEKAQLNFPDEWPIRKIRRLHATRACGKKRAAPKSR